MKKCILYLGIFLGLILFGFGIYRFANPSIVKVNDEQLKSVIKNGTLSEDGYYYTPDLFTLYLYDLMTGQSIVACNRPDCHHNSNLCNARFSSAREDEMIVNIFLYADNIYVETRNLDTTKGRIYVCDMNSGKKELVREIDGTMEGMVVSQGCLYYITDIFHEQHEEEVAESSYVGWSENTCELHKFDLRTRKDKVLYEWNSDEQCVSQVFSLCEGDYDATQYIYGILFYYESAEEAVNLEITDMHASLYRYDIKSEKMEAYAISDELSMASIYAWIYNDKLYYTHYGDDACTEIICYDPSSRQGELYLKSDREYGTPEYIDGYFIFTCNQEEPRLACFDLDSEKLYISKGLASADAYSIFSLSRSLNLVAYDGTDYKGVGEGVYTSNPCTYMVDALDAFLSSQYDLYENGYAPYVFLGD